ncbi:MAG: futalosine hydrolase [Bacteroidota bacterium]|jgi:hypothetical protein
MPKAEGEATIMKLLLCVPALNYIEPALASLSVSPQPVNAYTSSVKILQHEVDILQTGSAIYETTYKLTKALSSNKYHLALKLSTGGAYKPELPTGSILNIVNEKPADFGTYTDGTWHDIYDLKLADNTAPPHVRGGLVNMTNAYMNVFLPIKKVVGITVNHFANKNEVALRREKYKADCETTTGAGFAYTCLFEKQTFYHICAVERNLATGEENYNLAITNMNAALVDILQKI